MDGPDPKQEVESLRRALAVKRERETELIAELRDLRESLQDRMRHPGKYIPRNTRLISAMETATSVPSDKRRKVGLVGRYRLHRSHRERHYLDHRSGLMTDRIAEKVP